MQDEPCREKDDRGTWRREVEEEHARAEGATKRAWRFTEVLEASDEEELAEHDAKGHLRSQGLITPPYPHPYPLIAFQIGCSAIWSLIWDGDLMLVSN